MFKKLVLLVVLAGSLASCRTYTPVMNSNLHEIDFSDIAMYEKGKDCSRKLLGILPIDGNESVINAIKRAKIRNVKVVDRYKGIALFTLGTKSCVIVYGTR